MGIERCEKIYSREGQIGPESVDLKGEQEFLGQKGQIFQEARG